MTTATTMTTEKISLSQIAKEVDAYHQCFALSRPEERAKCEEAIQAILKPLNSLLTFDTGIRFNYSHSTPNRLLFNFMWQDKKNLTFSSHILTITPAFGGFNIDISGDNSMGQKDMLRKQFSEIFQP